MPVMQDLPLTSEVPELLIVSTTDEVPKVIVMEHDSLVRDYSHSRALKI